MGPRTSEQGQVAGKRVRLNIADEFAAMAARQPNAPAVIVATRGGRGTESLTFGRCQQLTEQYANGLLDYGVQLNHTALVLMKPVLDLAPVFLALWKIGAIPVALDGGGPREQKLKAIEEIGPQVMIGIPLAHVLRMYYGRRFRSISHPVTAGNGWFLRGPTLRSFRKAAKGVTRGTVESTSEDPMAIVFTTGSTGPAKGVVYTHGNGAAVVQMIRASLGMGPGERCLAGHPAFAMHFIGSGATAVIPDIDPRRPWAANPASVLETIRAQRPTIAFLQLSVIRNLVRYCAIRGEKIPHLRKILTTGAPVPVDLVEGLHRCLEEPDADLHIMYGATEALYIAYATGRDLLARAPEILDGKGTYLGRPSPSMAVEVIGITGRSLDEWDPALALPRGQIGEFCVSGPTVTPAYWGRPEDTRHAKIHDARGLWHRTGDAGYLDDEGHLWFCGRIADRVNTESGYVYSDLVEPIINRHDGVARSALVGVPARGSSRKRPVMVIEPTAPGPADWTPLTQGLRLLAERHANTRPIEDFLVHQGTFPVDVRHGAKIRRDLLAEYAATQIDRDAASLAARDAVLFKGHRVVYLERGQGEPMLFLHNAGNDHSIWEHQIEYFSRIRRVIAADSLGYGGSDKPRVDYTLSLYTDMVAALVDTLALAPVTLVGSCTGAAMALSYALENPRKVRRLILFHIATRDSVRGGSLERTTRLVAGRPRVARIVTRVLEVLMSRGMLNQGIVQGQYGGSVQDDAGFLRHLHRLYRARGQAGSLLSLFSNWQSFARLDQVQYPRDFPPLHVFWGDSNKVLPLARGRELCRTLDPLTLDVIEGGGHLAMREWPELINRRMYELLEADSAPATKDTARS